MNEDRWKKRYWNADAKIMLLDDNYLKLIYLGSTKNITICRFCDERIDGQINHEDCLEECLKELHAEGFWLLK